MNLRGYIIEAKTKGIAIGHFNASTLDGILAIADAAQKLKVPVIVGLSEGERDYVGVKQAAAIIKSLREERGQPIFLNADHTYSFSRVKEAIDAGFDSVIFDGAQLSLEENIREAKKCVEYAKTSAIERLKIEGLKDSSDQSREVLIEGELGFIGTSSKILDAIPDGAITREDDMTKPSDALRFVRETGVDLLAPAVGNVHGVVRGGEPALNIGRVKAVADAVPVPLVLHGASGNTAEDIRASIKAGVAIVHVNTELRIAYRGALVKSMSENHEELSPYKYLKPAKLAMQKVVEEKLKIFVEV
ncbi:MAG: class II fructose-bisphosphate aldolase [Candidatus Taylorbacteria bacterium]